MARNRDPFMQALSSLRERIQSGRIAGGSPVIVQDEAVGLRLSTTPVRGALARLSGEGLVERAPSGGYVALRLDATAARDRYMMHAQFVRIALDLNRRALAPLLAPAPDIDIASPDAAERLFTGIVRSAGNQVLWEAFQKVSGQLDIMRRLESRLFGDGREEADALYRAYAADGDPPFEALLDLYHDRRIRASGALAALAERGPEQA